MKEIRAAPNKRFDGSILYTLPVLSDPNTGAVITDSLQIAEYLEKTYPEKPIFPNQTKALIHVYDAAYFSQIRPSCVFPIMRVKDILNERSVDYFVTTRQKTYNREFSQLSMEGPEREQHWATLEEGYSTIKSWYDKSDGKWLVGDLFSYADIVTGSWLLWMKKVLHRDEWERIASWHDGKLATLLADVERECKLV
ncbi:hypothetical protein ID866_3632 [Astraeus odoratus]|nr:hypothetical protein ID866_3632 [Astraeus odoratus]